jgi:hypothetical protein
MDNLQFFLFEAASPTGYFSDGNVFFKATRAFPSEIVFVPGSIKKSSRVLAFECAKKYSNSAETQGFQKWL